MKAIFAIFVKDVIYLAIPEAMGHSGNLYWIPNYIRINRSAGSSLIFVNIWFFGSEVRRMGVDCLRTDPPRGCVLPSIL